MTKSNKFLNRDISWLSFNGRVLEEAGDKSLPLYERLKIWAQSDTYNILKNRTN